ncbi:MAG: LamG-like jellyroll fold domain-containing protein [candidate division FCPU426 bacterium]
MKKLYSIGLLLGIAGLVLAGCAQNNPVAPAGMSALGSSMKAQSVGAPGSEKVASGQVTITKGMFYHQEPLVINGENGQVVFEAVHLGHWDIYVELFNAQGVLIYAGAAEAVVKPNKTTEVMVAVTDDLGSITPQPTPPGQGNPPENNTGTLIVNVDIPVPPIPEGLIFWNRLGNPDEVQNSEVGVPGVIVGTPNYDQVQHDGGAGYFPTSYTYIIYNNLFGSDEYSGFAIEFWTKWREAGNEDYSFLMAHENENSVGNKVFFINANQTAGAAPQLGLQLLWNYTPESSIIYLWYPHEYLVDGLIEHIAYVVDLSAASGQKVKLYVDGQDIGAPAYYNEVNPLPTYAFPQYVEIGERVSHTWVLRNYIDNIKIWNYPKTDFSDRFTE